MRTTLIIVVILVILLSVLLGYIIGSEKLSTQNVANESSPKQSENSTGDNTQSSNLPNYDSLLVMPDTEVLPLNLQAGAYYDEVAAQAAVLKLKTLGFEASVKQFSDHQKDILYVIILKPFNNEAQLQLAQYKLTAAKIMTQRVATLKAGNTE